MTLLLDFYTVIIKSLLNIWLHMGVIVDNYVNTNLCRIRETGLILILQVSQGITACF